MARSRSSEIYQVDLVAALFGGFMIAWLVSAKDSDFQVYSEPFRFATIEMRVAAQQPIGGSKIPVWYNSYPSMAREESKCLGLEVSEDLIGGLRQFQSCASSEVGALNTNVARIGSHLGSWLKVHDPCIAASAGSPANKTTEYNISLVFDVELPTSLSAIGSIQRRFSASELAAGPYTPIFMFSRSNGNCTVQRGVEVLTPVFLVSDFDTKNDTVSLPLNGGNGSLLLTGQLRNSTNPAQFDRIISLTNEVEIIDASNQIAMGGSASLTDPVIQVLLCVFDDGTEFCYGGEAPLTNAGAPSLTLTKGVVIW